MSKEIVVNVGDRETRIAVVEDGRLTDLHIEREERVVSSIYKARVENVLPGLDAAFVDIGLSRNAFLYVGDVLPGGDSDSSESNDGGRRGGGNSSEEDDLDSEETETDETEEGAEGDEAEPAEGAKSENSGRRPTPKRKSNRRSVLRQQKIGDVLKVGQEILVQVIKGPRGTKGARVSTRISLPGRYLVLMPEADNIGVSRKIADGKERDRLKKIGEKMREAGFGIIIRTEAEDKTEADLMADKAFLMHLWKQIQENQKKMRAPSLVHQDLTLIYKTIRDIFGSDVNRLVIDNPAEYEKANELLEMVSPKLRGRIHLYSADVPVFDHFNIESEIERSIKRKVWLRSGGYLIIDETEALTVVDVNTGKNTGGSSLSETIVRTNIDAANEIARQLRLRDIGGIIVIDFIDMDGQRDKQTVIRTLENALKKDRARTKISNISPLGLIEMTRKRTDETITDFLTEPCTYCGGRGKLPSPETISITLEREIRRSVKGAKKEREALLVTCHPDVAELIIGAEAEGIDRVEREVQRAIYIRAKEEMHLEKFEIVPGDIAEFEKKVGQFRRAQVVECRITTSKLQPESGIIGWADGFLIELKDGKKFVGQRMKVTISDVRRSMATGSVVQGTNRPLDKSEII